MSSNIPKLRFAEFSEEWKPYTLKQLCQKPMYGLNTPSTVYDGENGYIRITDIDETSRKFVKENITSPLGFSDDYLLSDGDILFARTGASVGKSYKYQTSDGKLYFAGFLIKFSVTKASAPFVFYQTLRSEYNKWVKMMSMRSGQPGVNAEEYGGYQSLYPKQDEQKKIAEFLSAVDCRIEGLEMMMDLQKRYKQGVMQRIFNQTIRFKDDNCNPFPDWQEVKLGNICEMQSGKFVAASNIHASQTLDMYPCYGGNGLRGYTESFTHDGEFPLIGRQGALCGNITCANGKFHATEHAVVATANSNIDSRWLFYQLIKLNLNKYATGQAQPGLSIEIIK